MFIRIGLDSISAIKKVYTFDQGGGGPGSKYPQIGKYQDILSPNIVYITYPN